MKYRFSVSLLKFYAYICYAISLFRIVSNIHVGFDAFFLQPCRGVERQRVDNLVVDGTGLDGVVERSKSRRRRSLSRSVKQSH